jgi:predicted RNA-binding protein
MIDFGPDGHCDGADVIAALALQWAVETAPIKHSEEPASMIVTYDGDGIVRIGIRDAVKLHSGDVIEIDLEKKTVWIDEGQR